MRNYSESLMYSVSVNLMNVLEINFLLTIHYFLQFNILHKLYKFDRYYETLSSSLISASFVLCVTPGGSKY